MAAADARDLKWWVETWARAGPALEAVRLRELRTMPEADRLRTIDALLDLGARLAVPRPTSGLVEQQRLFAKVRR